jgi:hypothetical protein
MVRTAVDGVVTICGRHYSWNILVFRKVQNFRHLPVIIWL